MSFAQKLKSLRLEHDMTQESVAKYMNVARSTIALLVNRVSVKLAVLPNPFFPKR